MKVNYLNSPFFSWSSGCDCPDRTHPSLHVSYLLNSIGQLRLELNSAKLLIKTYLENVHLRFTLGFVCNKLDDDCDPFIPSPLTAK